LQQEVEDLFFALDRGIEISLFFHDEPALPLIYCGH
jgi:hypothetical protein